MVAHRLRPDRPVRGATATEYVLLALGIAIAGVSATVLLGRRLAHLQRTSVDALDGRSPEERTAGQGATGALPGDATAGGNVATGQATGGDTDPVPVPSMGAGSRSAFAAARNAGKTPNGIDDRRLDPDSLKPHDEVPPKPIMVLAGTLQSDAPLLGAGKDPLDRAGLTREEWDAIADAFHASDLTGMEKWMPRLKQALARLQEERKVLSATQPTSAGELKRLSDDLEKVKSKGPPDPAQLAERRKQLDSRLQPLRELESKRENLEQILRELAGSPDEPSVRNRLAELSREIEQLWRQTGLQGGESPSARSLRDFKNRIEETLSGLRGTQKAIAGERKRLAEPLANLAQIDADLARVKAIQEAENRLEEARKRFDRQGEAAKLDEWIAKLEEAVAKVGAQVAQLRGKARQDHLLEVLPGYWKVRGQDRVLFLQRKGEHLCGFWQTGTGKFEEIQLNGWCGSPEKRGLTLRFGSLDGSFTTHDFAVEGDGVTLLSGDTFSLERISGGVEPPDSSCDVSGSWSLEGGGKVWLRRAKPGENRWIGQVSGPDGTSRAEILEGRLLSTPGSRTTCFVFRWREGEKEGTGCWRLGSAGPEPKEMQGVWHAGEEKRTSKATRGEEDRKDFRERAVAQALLSGKGVSQRVKSVAIPDAKERQFYAHGGFYGAAPELMKDEKWCKILKALMPDVHADLEKAVAGDGGSAKFIAMMENNPVMAAYGIWKSNELGLLVRTGDKFENLGLFEVDVFLPTGKVREWRKEENDDRKREMMKGIVAEMLIAHGDPDDTRQENQPFLIPTKGFPQYDDIRTHAKKTQLGGLLFEDWIDLFGKAVLLAKAGDLEASLQYHRWAPRVESTDEARKHTFVEKMPFDEAIAAYRQALGADRLSLLLDLKSRDVGTDILVELTRELNRLGVHVGAVASFVHSEIRFARGLTGTQKVQGVDLPAPDEIKFYHYAGNLQADCDNGNVKRGDMVMFNGGSLVDYPAMSFGGAKLRWERLREDVVQELEAYQAHYGFRLGIYVQEDDIDPKTSRILADLAKRKPRLIDLGYAWGGLGGKTPGDILPSFSDATTGTGKQHFTGKSWKLKPGNAQRYLLEWWIEGRRGDAAGLAEAIRKRTGFAPARDWQGTFPDLGRGVTGQITVVESAGQIAFTMELSKDSAAFKAVQEVVRR